MQVHVFSASSATELQASVTNWLTKNPDITITTALQSIGQLSPTIMGDERGAIILTIFYTADVKESPIKSR